MNEEERIEVTGPWITQREMDYVAEATRTNWFGRANDFIGRFEAAFARHAGRKHALATSSCSSAIQLALKALGVGPGDEVIVPELTWIATVAPAVHLGATPIFVDVDPVNWCMDPESFRRAITPRTKVVIPVDLYGTFPPLDKISAIAQEHGVTVLEDSAQAIGATYQGKPAGSFGRASVFSFHGSKTLTTGEGGILVTDDTPLYERAVFLADQGRKPTDRSLFNHEVGFKMKMSAMQAALGLAQLERLPELIAAKRQHHEWYRARLARMPGLQFNHEGAGVYHSHWMTNIVWPAALGLDKEHAVEFFRQRGIMTRPLFYPLSCLPAFAAFPSATMARKQNAVSYEVSPRSINLPSGFHLTEAKVARICDRLEELLRR